MGNGPKLHISFEPVFCNVDMVRAAVRGVCTDFFQLPCGAECVMDFCLIVTELMNNAVRHSDTEMITAELCFAGQEAVFCLITEGTRFDPTVAAIMPGLGQNGELPDRGYGLSLVQRLADGMEYEYRENKNLVTLRKNFSVKPEEER